MDFIFQKKIMVKFLKMQIKSGHLSIPKWFNKKLINNHKFYRVTLIDNKKKLLEIKMINLKF